ncbi:helix-turn-helix transcriptional regulator [Paenibacillus sp. GSMTC-2017]|uniref:helix-turn-helix transcriptional regulator n=1 Tax=Paenibacillus sp. GSMTC-2017 TaxID=2794350 RepID=UPI0018D73384|nr:AraC family transcriptional regulator [Paenibacillus sp. GSMTC-2017]MBH5319437.1 helix-turn-helix transcriptional regulator [Paenibacillus sp. GSMTC-2017]
MLNSKKSGSDKSVMAAIETIEEVDFLLMTQLTVWFVLSGYLEIMRNGSDILIRTGDIFVLNKGDIVRVIGSKENATLTVKFLTNEYQDEFPSFKQSIPLSMVYKKDGYELVKNSMAYLYIEMIYPGEGSDYIIEGYSKRIIGLLYRYLGSADEKEQAHATSDKVKEIVSYINVNYAEKLSLDEIAEKFYSSKYYLAHSFKNQLGISIGNYIKEVRLFHSYQMLESTHDKIVTIALASGFPNVRSFNEAFKIRYKLTPAEFREKSQLREVQSRADVALSQDVLALLSPYVALGELPAASPIVPERIEVQLDLNETAGRYHKVNHILKVKGELSDSRLYEVRDRLGVKWVAVTRLFEKVDIKMNDGKLVCSFRALDHMLQQIVSVGMYPYLQFQSIDFDDWKERGFPNNESFESVMTELSVHLQQNYRTSPQWMFEFRCFYEWQSGGELCLPIANAISIFKGYNNIVIHFPVQPVDEVLLNDSNSHNTVYWIDDWTRMRKIQLDAALNHLFDEVHIQVIGKNTNIKAQNRILDRMMVYEQDDYMHAYSDLAQANASIWNYIKQMNQFEIASHYFPPLSLDSAKLFEYFPDELASRMSLCTPDGRYKDNWYATEFVSRLYDGLVYQNNSCIVTKQQENYRILTVYPEEELHLIMNQNNEQIELAWRKAKSPYLFVKLGLENIEGTYRLIKQRLTPEQIDQRLDLADLRKCKKLSFDDIAYWNAINRPSRSVEQLKIKGNHTLEFEVPIFGIVMIDLEKINA